MSDTAATPATPTEPAKAPPPDAKAAPAVVPPAPAAPAAPTEHQAFNADLIEQRRALRVEERRVAEQRKELATKLARLDEVEKLIADAKADPLKALELGGHDFTAAQKAALEAAQKGAPVAQAKASADEAKAELAALRAELEQERQTAQVARIHADIKTRVAAGDAYDLVKSFQGVTLGDKGLEMIDGTDLVALAMAEHWNETHEEIALDEAIAKTEAWLESKWLPGISSSKKLAAKFAPPPQEAKKTPADAATANRATETPGPPTLRSADLAVSSPPPNGSDDWEARIGRAAQRLNLVTG